MDKKVKEQSQAKELQQMVDTWSNMNRYAFYMGTSRGVLSCMNSLCLRFGGMTFEEYTKAAFKPQLNQMFTLGQALQLLGSLLKSIDELVNAAMTEAQKDVENEKKEGENNEKDKSGKLAE